MNQKGGIFGFFNKFGLVTKIIIIVTLAVLVIPGLMASFPIVKYFMMAIIVFWIYQLVTESLGKGIISYIVVGILAYFIVYKYLYLSASLMMLYIFMAFGVMSVFVWGTSTLSKK